MQRVYGYGVSEGLWFRVHGVGFILGSELKMFTLQVLRFRVQELGFRVSGVQFRMQGILYRT